VWYVEHGRVLAGCDDCPCVARWVACTKCSRRAGEGRMARGDEHRGAVGDGRAGVAGWTCDRGYSMTSFMAALRRQSGVDMVGDGKRGLQYMCVR
jgi:hypothetical protein